MELVALLKTCWKRKWIILAFTVILPLFTLIACLKMTKVYESVAKVKLVQFEGTQSLLQKQIPETWGQLDHVTGIPTNSQAEVLRSRMVVEPVIKGLDLRRRVTIIDKTLNSLGLIDEYRDENIRLEKLVEPGFIGAFLQRRQIYIEPIEDSDIIEVYAYSDILEEARDMANGVAESYVKEASKLKQEEANEALGIIERNLADAGEGLQKAQDDLKKFQETHIVVNLDKRIADTQGNLNDLENQRQAVRNDLMVRTSRLRELTEGDLDTSELQATLKSTEAYPHIQDLQSRLIDLESSLAALLVGKTPKHPAAMELQAQIDGIKRELFAEINRLLETEIIELDKTQEALAISISEKKKELKNLADTSRQLEDLQRQVDSAESFYLSLGASRDSALTAAATNYGNATIITYADLPDPTDPYYPEPPLYTILALIVGLMFGFGMAFIVEFMDLSVKSAEDIKQASNLALLGAMPKTRRLGAPKLNRLDSGDKFAGAVMEIRHNVLQKMDDKKVIAVASGMGREGKTRLICHLAMALADNGQKVALVDLNLKDPAVHKMFNVSNRSGVSDFMLLENGDPSAVVQAVDGFPRLGIFPAGPNSGRYVHKLDSEVIGDFIEVIARSYDCVLLDAASLDSLAGGLVVAAKADGTLLVVSVEGPSAQQVRETVSALKGANVEIMGVVANRVSV